MQKLLALLFHMHYKFLIPFLLLSGAVSTGLKAQFHPGDRPVTYVGKEVELWTFFTSVWEQTKLQAFYNNEQLSYDSIITVKFEREPLDNVLAFLFRKRGLTWFYSDETFVILPIKPGQPILGELPEEAGVWVNGQVRNKAGIPLENATIVVRGQRKGARTDANGQFFIPKIKKGTTLIVSCIGYYPTQVKVRGRDSLHVRLQEAVTTLDEAIIIAYGTSSRRNLTGSVSRVTAEDIAKQPVANPLLAMQGRVPGLHITQLSGLPGGDVKVELRGRNSIAAGNNPMYIVDGVPFPSTPLTFRYGSSNNEISVGLGPITASPLNMLNVADIASIEVLKDADATAIYGSRGANGVILITTKKAKVEKMKMDVNVYTGVGKAAHMVQYLNTQQYLQMRREAFKNDGVDPHSFDYDINGAWDTTRYTNWQKMLIGGTAHITDGQVAISGGTDLMQCLLSGGYRKETTAYPGNFNYQKAAGRFNFNMSTPDHKGRVSFAASYVADRNFLPSLDLTALTATAPDAPPVYNADGTLNWANGTFDQNPMAIALRTYKARTNSLLVNGVLSYELLPGLQLKTSLGYNNMQMDEVQPIPMRSFNPALSHGGFSYFANSTIKSVIAEPQAVYERKVAKGQLNILAGGTFQQVIRDQKGVFAYGFTSDALLENITAAASINPLGVAYYQYHYNALFGRINYNWEEKYILNLTGRRDGSSRFGPGRQFANFGAVGAAWIFSKERGIQQALPFLSFGKLRGSYGITGNDQIADYGYNATYSPSQPYQGFKGLSPTRLFNPDYSWELSKKLEAGLELGFVQDQLFFRASYYRNRSSNQLVNYTLSGLSGFNAILNNFPALVENTGWEFEWNSTNIRHGQFKWSTAFNISIPNNKLLAFPGLESTSYKFHYTVGQPLNILKGYHYLGVNPQTGLSEFVDADKDGKITFPNDYAFAKKTGVFFYGGLQNNWQYKGWQLDVLFQFVKQHRYNYLYAYSTLAGINVNLPVAVLDRWQAPGDNTSIQRFTQAFGSPAAQAYQAAANSDQAIMDASFIRLKNLSLSYQLPAKWMQSAHLQSARFYLQGQNLFTITNYKGRDPEVATSNDVYPPLRVWTVGLQLGL